MARPKKIQHFEIRKYINRSGKVSWRVSGTKADGVRVRQNFATRAEAAQAMADFESRYEDVDGRPALRRTRLSEGQLADAEAAFNALGGRSLSAVVSRHDALLARATSKGFDPDATPSLDQGRDR